MVIQVPAALSADTSAAFGCTDCIVPYTPQPYISYYQVSTDIILNIKNSANTNVHTQNVQKNILWSSTESVQFSQWLPPAADTYTISVTTHVTDDQCANVIDDSASNSVTVWPHYPKNECWTEVQGLQVLDQGTAKYVGEPITIRFQKRSQYAPNYDPWETQYDQQKKKIATEAKIYLGYGSAFDLQKTQIIQPSGTWGTYETVDVTFTPTKGGELKIRASGTGSDTVCTGKQNTGASADIDIVINECHPGETRSCYTGAAGTAGIGVCKAGTEACGADLRWSGNCAGQIIPSVDSVCDSIDTDCDGKDGSNTKICACTDGAKLACTSFEKRGECGKVMVTCTNGLWGECPSKISDEACYDSNNLDEDCDGFPNCQDAECIGKQAEICSDSANVDEDCDGYPNCMDTSDCSSVIVNFMNICTGSCVAGHFDKNLRASDGCEFSCVETNGGIEICDGLDNDCDDDVDEDVLIRYYNDTDGDGFGNKDEYLEACSPPKNYVLDKRDCDDEAPKINPNATDICEAQMIDENCDGVQNCPCIAGTPIACKTEGVCATYHLTCGMDGKIPACDYTGISGYEASETLCDGKDNDCDGKPDAYDNLDCCSIDQVSKACSIDCWDGSSAAGKAECVNFKWGACNADCPAREGEIKIDFPKNGEEYKTCGTDKSMAIAYTGPSECQYRSNSNPYFTLNPDSSLKAALGENRLIVKCGELQAESKFTLVKETCTVIEPTENPDIMVENGLSQDILDMAENTPAEHELSYSYDGDSTTIINSIIPQEEMGKSSFYLNIPKCLTPYLDDLEFELEPDEIINPDPLVAWHFATVNERVDLSYKIKKKIDEKCLKEIQGLPILDRINVEKPTSFKGFLIPIIVFLVAGVVFMFLQKREQSAVHELSEEESEKAGILAGWNMMLKRVKKEKFKTKDQADSYMRALGVDDKEREWVLSKL
ncbi:MAG: MopE-related protein [Candidatus Woesearchaeota archaeon]|nr:MopE-related protein [Candidatus Woesearchaeota archaeon]